MVFRLLSIIGDDAIAGYAQMAMKNQWITTLANADAIVFFFFLRVGRAIVIAMISID